MSEVFFLMLTLQQPGAGLLQYGASICNGKSVLIMKKMLSGTIFFSFPMLSSNLLLNFLLRTLWWSSACFFLALFSLRFQQQTTSKLKRWQAPKYLPMWIRIWSFCKSLYKHVPECFVCKCLFVNYTMSFSNWNLIVNFFLNDTIPIL